MFKNTFKTVMPASPTQETKPENVFFHLYFENLHVLKIMVTFKIINGDVPLVNTTFKTHFTRYQQERYQTFPNLI